MAIGVEFCVFRRTGRELKAQWLLQPVTRKKNDVADAVLGCL